MFVRRFVALVSVALSVYAMGCMADPTEEVEGAELSADTSEEAVGEAEEALTACGSGLCCKLSWYSGMGSACQSGSQVAYCCPSGYGLAGGSCIAYCPSGRSCGTTLVAGASACAQNCNNWGVGYCCPAGKTYTATGCK